MKQRGFLKLLIVIIIAVVLLAYFNVDLRHWIDKLGLKPLFEQIWHLFAIGWQKVVDAWHYLTK